MKLDVLTIGSGTRDVFLNSDKFKIVKTKKFKSGLGECISLGDKIELKEILLSTGGGATNAAVTFARLGYKTATICKLGDDNTGDAVIEDLQSEGVRTNLIKIVRGGETAYSTILTEPGGERSVLVYRGVSKNFTKSDIPLNSCQLSDWTYMTSLGGNISLCKAICNKVGKCKNKIMWNPGSLEIKKGLSHFKSVIKHVSVLNMNKEEAQKLTGQKSVEKMLKTLSSKDNVVLITDGPRGTHAILNDEYLHSGTTGAPSISRTGAGDAFGSGFLSSYIKDRDIARAMAIGTLNAESVIGIPGAKAGILKKSPSTKEIKKISIKKKKI